jgi:hypothetical protein
MSHHRGPNPSCSMASSKYSHRTCKGKANMRKELPLQEVADDLYTHDIL